MGVAFNHLGHCVADLARAAPLLRGAARVHVPRARSSRRTTCRRSSLGLDAPIGMTACYLQRDGLVLELLHFAAEGSRGTPARVSG